MGDCPIVALATAADQFCENRENAGSVDVHPEPIAHVQSLAWTKLAGIASITSESRFEGIFSQKIFSLRIGFATIELPHQIKWMQFCLRHGLERIVA